MFFKSFFILSLNNFAKRKVIYETDNYPACPRRFKGTLASLFGRQAIVHLPEENKIKFAGKALFPLSDVSIADRKDHVNVTAVLFALWNAAHLMARHIGKKNFRITRLSSNYLKTFLPPEDIVDFSVSASLIKLRGRK